jgi:hypothetical protein
MDIGLHLKHLSPKYQEINLVSKLIISFDIDPMYGFWERVTDAFASLGSRGAGRSPLALIAGISESKNC